MPSDDVETSGSQADAGISSESGDERQQPRVVVLGDETGRQTELLVKGKEQSFQEEYERPSLDLAQRLRDHLSSPVGGVDAVVLLEEQLDAIEAAMATRLHDHSQYYWLHLSRRIPPTSSLGSSVWNTLLSRRVLDTAVLKHGLPDRDARLFASEFATEDDASVPRDLTYEDVLHIYQVERLAYLYDFTTGCLRRVWKGGVLRKDDLVYAVDNSFGQEVLIQSRDERMWENSGYLTGFGTVVDTSIDPAVRDDGDILVLPPNATQAPFWPAFPDDPPLAEDLPAFVPNYLLVPFRVTETFDLLSLFEDELMSRFGFGARDLLACVWGLVMRQFGEIEKDISKRYHLLQRAYVLMGVHNPGYVDYILASVYASGMRELFDEHVTPKQARQTSQSVRRALAYDPANLSKLSLWDGGPVKVFLPLASGVVCDYSAIHNALRGIVDTFASEAGELGNIKGSHFQDQVENLFRSAPGCQPWMFKKELHSGSGDKCEIDASIVVGSTLYVAECKAMAQPYLVSRGEIGTLRRRWEVLENHCKQASAAAQFIERNRSGRNFTVPDEVTTIEWAVLTPDVEYIPTIDDAYWLAPFVPRVLTPKEFLAYVVSRG